MVRPNYIDYLTHKVEVDLPDQLAKAEEVLGRVTIKHYGQLELEIERE